jgi:murein DD-endopeptidase MepM/ murein hydrolase activator NlpD
MTIVAAVIGLAIIAWTFTLGGSESAGQAEAPTAATPASVALEPERDPTPRLAQVGSTVLRLPIDPGQVTGVAFHQASGEAALHMTSLVPDADMALADQLKAIPPLATPADPADDIWDGCCLRLWRSNRGGQPDSAVDTGADPGTPVWSPVSGTVVQVRPYLLYEKYDDFEIHIRPSGREDVDVVLIHLQDVRVKAGDRVKAGVTQLASVRQMSDKISIQLGGYTPNGGDHVHMQVNRAAEPGESDAPGGS